MDIRTLNGLMATVVLLGSNAAMAEGMEVVRAPGMAVVQPPRGMEVVKAPGMAVEQPPRGMEVVRAPGMAVEQPPRGMEVVKAPGMALEQPPLGMDAARAPGMTVEQPPRARGLSVAPPPPPMPAAKPQVKQAASNTQGSSRGRAIDPNGQGLNQAQIDAMEAQRRMMWNATGGGMVYR